MIELFDLIGGAFVLQQLSQFWYDETTKKTLTKVCLRLIVDRAKRMAAEDVKVALISCPSLYKSIRKIHSNGVVRLFEFDQRFAIFAGDYIHYDYKSIVTNVNYMEEFTNYFDIIIADPPFLSDECIHAVSMLINRIRKNDSSILLCSGDVIALCAQKYMQLHKCAYRPQHERNLANEFGTYANFDLDSYV